MRVQMLRHAGARSTPLIDPEIDSLWLKRTLHQIVRNFNKIPKRRALMTLVIKERRSRIPECDEQMSVRVRKCIQQNHAVIITHDDMVRSVIRGITPVIQEKRAR